MAGCPRVGCQSACENACKSRKGKGIPGPGDHPRDEPKRAGEGICDGMISPNSRARGVF
ncbi:Phosphoenolpyruvate synthase protein (fragment) [Cupriavidus taiwanensis]|uniref:Uncharacterized protein n=1 Tax=Cupriavidus taiwanensis TaxID=164546 RepID=A0A375G2G2_9BURK|nr:hypothetical protein CBM2585_A130272 [Cupriavidus taiwanensis]SOY87658.1 protein of unknown function [Cupriavidus taiwanensis]SOZ05541.1 hypothetical protein CBM2595_A80226 [Cupriavidus taiwanensis]SOZ07525.1 hypothetical protein CBM2597_A90131 [Cupriavidus taiwanensis]SPC13871.1 hypothetical protein CT19431_80187 [Cupriavidus taiwanensis]